MTEADRNRKLGRLHQLKAQSGLDDATYRDKLERATGKRSAADCSDAELDRALDAFHVKQKANNPHTRKAKAAFIAAYNLGLFTVGDDAALDAFVNRQTGKPLRFLMPGEANSVTEALKAMLERGGMIIPPADRGGIAVRQALLVAQWKKLFDLGAINTADIDPLGFYAWKAAGRTAYGCSLDSLTAQELDRAATALGRKLRKAQAKRVEAIDKGAAA